MRSPRGRERRRDGGNRDDMKFRPFSFFGFIYLRILQFAFLLARSSIPRVPVRWDKGHYCPILLQSERAGADEAAHGRRSRFSCVKSLKASQGDVIHGPCSTRSGQREDWIMKKTGPPTRVGLRKRKCDATEGYHRCRACHGRDRQRFGRDDHRQVHISGPRPMSEGSSNAARILRRRSFQQALTLNISEGWKIRASRDGDWTGKLVFRCRTQ